MGTRIQGRLAGNFGDAAFFSFDSTKLINVPLKAGFVTVQSAEWFAELQAIFVRETGTDAFASPVSFAIAGRSLSGIGISRLLPAFPLAGVAEKIYCRHIRNLNRADCLLPVWDDSLAGATGRSGNWGNWSKSSHAAVNCMKSISGDWLAAACCNCLQTMNVVNGHAFVFRCWLRATNWSGIVPPTGVVWTSRSALHSSVARQRSRGPTQLPEPFLICLSIPNLPMLRRSRLSRSCVKLKRVSILKYDQPETNVS